MNTRSKLRRFTRAALVFWVVLFAVLGIGSQASAAVTNLGITFFGDNSATSQGVVRFKQLTTSPSTWGAQTNSSAASSTSFATWIQAKEAPTRDEVMVGALRINGTLDIQTCTNAGTCTARWNNPGTSGTLTCTTTATAGTCVDPWDLGYEALHGRAMVAYGDSAAGKFYYALWDGSAWSPNTAPGTPGATNQVALSNASAVPRWIRVIPSGDNLANDRSDRIMILVASSVNVSDASYTLDAFYWDGTTMNAVSNLSTTAGNCTKGRCFDGNWQGVNTFIVNYTSASTAEVRYRKYTTAGGWGADTQAYTTATQPIWIHSYADPLTDRIIVTTVASGNDTRDAIWRADNATDGWTTCSGGCPDTAIETVGGSQAFSAFSKFGTAIEAFNDAGTTADSSYWKYTPNSTWTGTATTGLTTTDDSLNTKVWGSPNSNNIFMLNEDVDCRLRGKMWTGSAWDATTPEMNNGTTATISNYGVTCPLSTAPGTAPVGIPYDYDFVWKQYSPWQRNWQFFSGSDTASLPTTSLAAEDTTPTNVNDGTTVRLRINYSERGTMSETDSRKKLQFTSGCNPNTSLESTCTWTNVGEIGGTATWDYADLTCTATDCADGTLLTGTKLTGSGACTQGNGCGTWVESGTAAAATTMDHNGSQVHEDEHIIVANGITGSTTYYFRLWDNDQQTPVYREQDNNDCGAGAAACTYPSLTTAAPVAATVSSTGTQTSSLTIPSTGQFLGGAFTLTRASGSGNLVSIGVTVSGSLTASGIGNMRLHYDTASSCSTSSFTAGVNQYGSTIAAPQVGKNTFTGSIPITTSTTCIYVVMDVTSSATDGNTIELSTFTGDVTIGGSTTTSNASIAGTTTLHLMAPTLTTSAASSITSTSATLNGTISSIGSAGPTTRGFTWGTASDLTGGTNLAELGTFANTYDSGGGDDEAQAIALDSSRHVYVGGFDASNGGDVVIRKYDENGVLCDGLGACPNWGTSGMVTWNSSGTASDIVYGLAVDSSNNVYAAGKYDVSGLANWYVRKYDANGVLCDGSGTCANWGTSGMVTYDSGAGNDDATSIVVDASKNIYVAGYIATNGGDMAVRKYDANGVLCDGLGACAAWGTGSTGMVTYNSAGTQGDYANAIAIDTSLNIFVAGYNGNNGNDWFVRKYNANGVLCDGLGACAAWGSGSTGMVTYNSSGVNDDEADAIVLDNAGNIYVAGNQQTNGYDWAIRKYNSNGVLCDGLGACAAFGSGSTGTITYNYTGANADTAWAMGIDSSNNIYPAGWIAADATARDLAVRKYNSDGVLCDGSGACANWGTSGMVTYNSGGSQVDRVRAIAVDSTAEIYVSGPQQTNTYDWLIQKYSSQGNDKFGTGAYTEYLTGLTCGTTYYVRAYATNSVGTGQGTIVSFTTSACTTTVGTTGTQTASLSIPSTNNFVGGAFTLTRSAGSANVTSITVTVNNATGLSNMKLYTDTVSSCTTADPVTNATLFGSNATVGATTTITGTAAVTTTTRCFYVVIDVGSGAADSQTLEISIASTGHVVVGSDTISGTAAVAGTTTLTGPAGLVISGSVYVDESLTTKLATTPTIRVAINGTNSQSVALSSGSFTLPAVAGASANDILTVYVDSATSTDQAVLITKIANGTSPLTLNLIANHVIVRYETGSSITNANLGAGICSSGCTGTNTNIPYSYNSGTGSITIPSANQLYIPIGYTFAPGGNVSAWNLDVQGTYSGSTEVLDINGTGTSATCTAAIGTSLPLCVGGNFLPPNSTKFSAISSTNIPAVTYKSLAFAPTSGSPTYTLASGTFTVNGSLSIGDASLFTPVTVTAATNTPSITVAGDLTVSSTGSFTKGGTLTFNGGTTQTWTDNNATIQDMGVVATATASTNLQLGSSVKATSLNIAASTTFTPGSNTLELTGTGTPFTVSGTFTNSNSTVKYSGTTATIAATTIDNLILGGTGTYTLPAADFGIYGNLTVTSGATIVKSASNTIYFAGSSGTITDNNTTKQDLGNLNLTSVGNFVLGSSIKATSVFVSNAAASLTFGGNYTLELTGTGAAFTWYPADPNFTTGTIKFTGTGANVNLDPTPTYNNLILGSGTAGTYVLATGASYKINGDLTISNNATVNNNATVIFKGGITQTWTDNNTTKQDLGTVVTSGASTNLQLGSSVKLSALQIGASTTFTQGSSGYYLTITGTGTGASRPFQNSGSFVGDTVGCGEVDYIGDGDVTVENVSYGGLGIVPTITASRIYTLSSGTTQSSCNTVINPGGGNAANTLTVNLGGNLMVSGTLYTLPSTVAAVLDTTSSNYAIQTNNLVLGSGSTLNANGSTFKITGPGVQILGTYNPGTGTTEFVSTSPVNIPAITYNDLKFDPASGSPTYTLGTGASQTLIAKNITLGTGSAAVTVTAATNNPAINISGNLLINNNVTFTKGSGAVTFNAGGSQTWTDNNAAAQDLGVVTTSAPSTNLSLGSNVKATSFTIAGSTTFTPGANTLELTGTGTPFVVTGTFTPGTSTIKYSGATANVTGTTYSSLNLNGTDTLPASDITLRGNLTVTASGVVTKSAANKIIFAVGGGSTQTVTDSAAAKSDLGIIQVSANSGNTTLNMGSNITLTSLIIDASQTFSDVSNTLTITGNGTVITANGTFSPLGTVSFTPAATTGVTIPAITFRNVILNKASNTFTAAAGTLSFLTGNLTITAGTLDLNTNDPTVSIDGTLTINGTLLASNTSSLTVKGGFTNNGTFTHNNGTVILAPSISPIQVTGTSNTAFYNLNNSTNGSRVNFKNGNTYTIDNALNFSSSASTSPITIGSILDGSQWFITFSTTPNGTMNFVSIKDAGCSGGQNKSGMNDTINNLGNNGTCWGFISRGGGISIGAGDASGGGTGTTGGSSGGGGAIGGGSGGGTGSSGGGAGGGAGGSAP